MKTSIVYVYSISQMGSGFDVSEGGFEFFTIALRSNSLYESIMICKQFNEGKYKSYSTFGTVIQATKKKLNRKRKRRYYWLTPDNLDEVIKDLDSVYIKMFIESKDEKDALRIITEACKDIGITVISNNRTLY